LKFLLLIPLAIVLPIGFVMALVIELLTAVQRDWEEYAEYLLYLWRK
jgi:hypothetical protein